MLYRRNEKGHFEAVTDKGKVIPFENASEMIAFIDKREELNVLLGRKESTEYEGMKIAESRVQNDVPESCGKTVKKRIHKGIYKVEGTKIKKSRVR